LKAKKVYEFQQGKNPYDTMGLGADRQPSDFNSVTDYMNHCMKLLESTYNIRWGFQESISGKQFYVFTIHQEIFQLKFIPEGMGNSHFWGWNLNDTSGAPLQFSWEKSILTVIKQLEQYF
jgi:hypothetical protein